MEVDIHPLPPEEIPQIPLMPAEARRESCNFLQEVGRRLELPQLTIATAIVFFHRFFARNSFLKYDKSLIATTCLFLAGKVEETPKKLKDVIIVSHNIRFKNQEPLRQESQRFIDLKETILTLERVLLDSLGFEFTVEHPYQYLLDYVKAINGSRKVAQVAWNFVNDSLLTTLCLQYRPSLIASAAIYLASRYLKTTLEVNGKPWWEIVAVSIEVLEDISNQLLDLYETSPINRVRDLTAGGGSSFLSNPGHELRENKLVSSEENSKGICTTSSSVERNINSESLSTSHSSINTLVTSSLKTTQSFVPPLPSSPLLHSSLSPVPPPPSLPVTSPPPPPPPPPPLSLSPKPPPPPPEVPYPPSDLANSTQRFTSNATVPSPAKSSGSPLSRQTKGSMTNISQKQSSGPSRQNGRYSPYSQVKDRDRDGDGDGDRDRIRERNPESYKERDRIRENERDERRNNSKGKHWKEDGVESNNQWARQENDRPGDESRDKASLRDRTFKETRDNQYGDGSSKGFQGDGSQNRSNVRGDDNANTTGKPDYERERIRNQNPSRDWKKDREWGNDTDNDSKNYHRGEDEDRDRYKNKSAETNERDFDRKRDRDQREREKGKDDGKGRWDREQDRDRDKDRDRDWDRNRDKDRVRDRDNRDKDRDRYRDRDRGNRDRSRDGDRDRDRERDRDRDKDKDKDKGRDKDRGREGDDTEKLGKTGDLRQIGGASSNVSSSTTTTTTTTTLTSPTSPPTLSSKRKNPS